MAPPQAQRDVERSEQRDRHSKSSAVHQDKVWSVTPWYEFSEEDLTMARCGALRAEARGQVVASWDPLKFSICRVFELWHAHRVRWVTLMCEFGVFLHFLRSPVAEVEFSLGTSGVSAWVVKCERWIPWALPLCLVCG